MKHSFLIAACLACILAFQGVSAWDGNVGDEFEFDEDVSSGGTRSLHHKKVNQDAGPAPIYPLGVVPPPPIVVQPVVQVQPAVKTDLVCPMGYALIGNRCEMTDVVPGDVICPTGLALVNGRCTQYSRGRRDCPEGYRLSGSRCIMTEVVSVEFTCPEGELDEAGTGCRTYEPASPVCPPSYVMGSDGMCSQSFAPQMACPEGFAHNGKKCLQNHAVDAAPVCPPGSEMDIAGDRCFIMRMGKAKCPNGFRMAEESGKCVKKAKKVLAPCPPGFSEFSQHQAICERILQVPPTLSCPAGSVLDAVTGQCIAETAPAVNCPPGTVQSREVPGMCERIAEELGSCPPGTVPVGYGAGLRCQTRIEHEIIECCPPGFELSFGKCERVELFPASNDCQGDCVSVRTLAPLLECPPNYQLMGIRCVGTIAHACPPSVIPPIPVECEPYMTRHAVILGGSGASLRSVQAVDLDQVPANCAPILAAVAAPPQLCHREESVPAQMLCPEGEFDGVNCVVRELLEVQPVCKVGIMDALGRCIRTTSVPIKTECPDGTSRLGNRCVEYQDHAPDFSCPPGAVATQVGMCVIRSPALVAPAEVLRSPPVSVCLSGTLQGNMCFDVERVPRQMVCPQGAIPAGRLLMDSAAIMERPTDVAKYCVVLADLVVPPPQKKYVKPRFVCPDGSPARGRHCHSVSNMEVALTCPPGTTLRGQMCIRQMPALTGAPRVTTALAVPLCPAGTVVQGTKCIATRDAPAMFTCPPGYITQPGGGVGDHECVRFGDFVNICPPGTRQTPDGCLRVKVVPPTVTTVECEPPNLC